MCKTEAVLIDLKAVALAGFILVISLVDYVVNDGATLVFLGKKLVDLIVFIQFWH
jgi:hypothetical protein